VHYTLSGKIVWHTEQPTSERRRQYGLPHVQHNKILSEIFEYYNLRLDKTKRTRENPK
jgi:hypothetical protein